MRSSTQTVSLPGPSQGQSNAASEAAAAITTAASSYDADGAALSKAFATALPAAFALAAAWRIAALWSKPVVARAGWRLLAKQLLIASLLGLQAYLVLACAAANSTTTADLVGSVAAVTATALLAPLSFLEHRRTVAPSVLIALFLWTSILQGAAETVQVVIAMMGPGRNAAGLTGPSCYVLMASRAVQLALAVVEELPKRRFLFENTAAPSPEATAGLLGRLSFYWLRDVFLKGYKGKLNLRSLGSIDDAFDSRKLLHQLRQATEQQLKGNKGNKGKETNDDDDFSLLLVLWSAFKIPLLWTAVPRLFQTAFSFAQPFLVSTLISFINRDGETSISGAQLVCFAGVTYLGITISTTAYNHMRNRFLVILRGSLVAALMQKLFAQSIFAASEDTAAALMSSDVDGLTSGVKEIHEVWGCAVDLVLSMYLLHREIGLASFLVVVPAAACFFLSERVSDGIGPARGGWAQASQDRVAKTSSFLGQIKSLKMMGLTNLVSGILQSLRAKEVEESKLFRAYIVHIIGVANISSFFTPAIIIMAAVFWTRAGGEGLTTAQAFTSLSIVSLVSIPIAGLSTIHPTLAAAKACLERIQTFLSLPEKPEKEDGSASSSAPSPLIQLQDVDATVPGKSSLLLSNVSLDIQESSVNMVIGPVGSGKSMFLLALLGEVTISKGRLAVGRKGASVAFCDQSPWLRNVSIRQNIVSYAQFDQTLYDKVLDLCSLKADLARLPQGDGTVAGSGGVSLSGGQRHRVALARALYLRRDILILDDVFSALDAATSSKIAQALFGRAGYLRNNGTTTILVASSKQHLRLADNIIVLDKDHHIQRTGQHASILSDNALAQQLDAEQSPTQVSAACSSPQAAEDTDEQQAPERVADWETYKFYISSVEPFYIIVFVLLAMGYMWIGKLPQVWLGVWTEHGTATETALYATVYMTLCVLGIVFSALVFWWFGLYMVPLSGLKMHQLLLDSYLGAPLWFLTGVDNGSILNRFSQDLNLIDQEMPFAVFETVLGVLDVTAAAAIMCYSAPGLVVAMTASLFAIGAVQRFYLQTSLTIRRLDIETKAPLYALLTDARSGLATIRAFGWQSDLMSEGLDLLDVSQKPYYLMMAIQQWLSLVIGLFVSLISVSLVLLAVVFSNTTNAAAIGLAMVSLMNFDGSLWFLVVAWTKMETSLGAATRVCAFAKDTPNEDVPGQQRHEAPSAWPARGNVSIDCITSSYKRGERAVVQGVSLDIEAGQMVGICGSTGSGKTSLLLTLLGLLETTSGSIKIDNVDLSKTLLQSIRSRLAVLPQDPVQLPGSVRDNLQLDRRYRDDEDDDEPLSLSSNLDMRAVLEKVGLWEVIERAENSDGLDTDFASLSLSHGQKQLFSVARTLLRKSQVVILDEATSSVDEHTDAQVQMLMREALKGRTVLSVAHRLESIADFDVVAVMENGNVVEVGDPKVLAKQEGSAFKKLWDQ